MKEEKVMYVNLPNDVEYRKAYVTEDGKVAIVYTEETSIDSSKTVSKALPKPTALIGGTEVYQKEGLPYWYCKIKDGRDEFMHLYFGDLNSNDILYTEDGKKREFVTERQKKFKANVMAALEDTPEEGFRWIPVYAPSEDGHGNLQYVLGVNMLFDYNCYEWEKYLQDYSPENGSRMATITTYFLLLLRLLKDGFATIEQLADDTIGIRHYWGSKDAKHEPEKTCKRQLGGLFWGLAGNTYKILSESDLGFSIFGGYLDGISGHFHFCPLAHGIDEYKPESTQYSGVGLLELTK